MIFQTKDTLIRPDWKVVAPLVCVGLGAVMMWILIAKVM